MKEVPRVPGDWTPAPRPMESVEQDALMVNALQRASSVVVRNSPREGFGLTIAGAMWKRVPILTNRRACGPRQQVRDGNEGRLVDDPESVEALAETMDAMLADAAARQKWARHAQRRVHAHFLVLGQLGQWMQLLSRVLDAAPASPSTDST